MLSPMAPTQARILVLTNTDSGGLSIGVPDVSGPGTIAFQIVSTDCDAVLLPGDSCTVSDEASVSGNYVMTALLAATGISGDTNLSRTTTGSNPMLAWSGSPTIAVFDVPSPELLPRTGQTILTVGDLSAGFTTIARGLDTVPDAFAIPPLTAQPPNTLVQSAWITPTNLPRPRAKLGRGGEDPDRRRHDTAWLRDHRDRPTIPGPPRQQRGRATVSVTVTIESVAAAFSVTSSS